MLDSTPIVIKGLDHSEGWGGLEIQNSNTKKLVVSSNNVSSSLTELKSSDTMMIFLVFSFIIENYDDFSNNVLSDHLSIMTQVSTISVDVWLYRPYCSAG